MATATTNRSLCDACGKIRAISKCQGCEKIFCYNHFGDHRQELNKQLDEVEVTRDLFRQTLTEQTIDPQKHILVQQINDWEHDSIEKIRQTANEARDMLLQHTTKHMNEIEVKLNELTNQLRHSRQENDFVETDLGQWKEQLNRLSKEVAKPSNILLQQDSKALVTKIYVDVSTVPLSMIKISLNARWKQNGITVAGGNESGSGLNQLHAPWGLYIDNEDQTVYIADTYNHRVVEWTYGATSGQVVAGGNRERNRADQLKGPEDVIFDKKSDSFIISDFGNNRVVQWPRQKGASGKTIISGVRCNGMAMDNDGHLYVPDLDKNEVRRWRIGDSSGTVVAGGNGRGNRLDQLYGPTYICVDDDYSVYVSDENNHRVMKWTRGAKEGITVAGGQGEGSSLSQLSNPRGVIVDQLGTIYVADYRNNRVMRWCKGTTQGSVVVGGNGEGTQPNQLSYPQDLSFDRQGNLYVVDGGNHRIQRFDIV